MKHFFPFGRVPLTMLTAALALSGALYLARQSAAAQTSVTMPAQVVVREDTEWCDVWLPHNNDTDLPHVLLIGDSITRGYGAEVEKIWQAALMLGASRLPLRLAIRRCSKKSKRC